MSRCDISVIKSPESYLRIFLYPLHKNIKLIKYSLQTGRCQTTWKKHSLCENWFRNVEKSNHPGSKVAKILT